MESASQTPLVFMYSSYSLLFSLQGKRDGKREREREYCDYVLQRPTTTDFIKVTVKVSDEPTAKVISGVERSQLIGLMMTDKLDCFGDALEESRSILIGFGVAVQLLHLHGYFARFFGT